MDDAPLHNAVRAPSVFARLSGQTSLRANIVTNYAGRAWELAMSVAFVPLYIRYLGPEAYGVIGVVALVQSFMLILDFGITPALTREAARYAAGEHDGRFFVDLVRSIEWVAAGISLIMMAGLALAAPWIAGHWVQAERLSPDTVALGLTVGGALIAMRFFDSIFRGALYGLQRQALCNLIAAIFATVRGAGAVAVVAWTGAGIGGFFAWQAVATLAGVLVMRAAMNSAIVLPPESQGPRFSRAALRSIGRFALGMVSISLLSLAATQADKLVLSKLISLRDFGYYIFAGNVALVLEAAAAPVMTALYPQVVALVAHEDDGGFAAFFHRWTRVIAVLTAAAAAWLVYYASPLIYLWSQDATLAASSGPILSVIALGTFLHGQCVIPYYFQLATGWTGLSIWGNALALAVTIPLLFVLVPAYGAVAGAWTWVAVASLYFFVLLQFMFARILRAERLRFYVGNVGLPAAAAFGTMALTRAVVPVDGGLWIVRALSLALALGLSLAAAAGCAWLVGRYRAYSGTAGFNGTKGLAAIASNTSR